jgi:hypothetical protein
MRIIENDVDPTAGKSEFLIYDISYCEMVYPKGVPAC